MPRRIPLRIAVDTGGTFTDLVAQISSGSVRIKVPSTPADPGQAVLDALAALSRRVTAPPSELRHGTTVATNALLERRGARVALITNRGFEDLLRLRRQNRPQLYALHPQLPAQLVAREHCLGIGGRRAPDGSVLEPLEQPESWIAAHRSCLEACQAFALCLLHSYVDAADETALARALRAAFPHTPLSVSSELAPVFREYERASTVAVNAFVAPVMQSYIERLARAIAPARLEVMGSAGGLLAAELAARAPVHTVLSGPAGGVRGAWEVGRRCGRSRLLTLDMGGTSADVSVVLEQLRPEDDGELDGHPLRVPLLPIETVGAGGGSIASVDAGGALRVGPRSAGAVPGPAAYGKAGPQAEPTVTDAHVVLGRLPDLLGGSFCLDRAAAQAAVGRLAERLGAGLEETARAVLATAEATMARACKRVSMERGVDPRSLSLVAFGGAGGLHACALAEELGCLDVVFPSEPGVLSAEGILFAPREAWATRSCFLDSEQWKTGVLDELLSTARARAETTLGCPATSREALADLRYRGQTFTLAVPFSSDAGALRTAFEAAHRERYGYLLPAKRGIELVAVRVYARSAVPSAPLEQGLPEEVCRGPRAISSYSATLWLPEGWQARRLGSGDWLCSRVPERGWSAEAVPEALSLEIHRQRLAAIAEEMGATLMRAAFSANIKERRDFSCAIFDAQGRMLVHAAHIPVHLGSTPLSVQAVRERMQLAPGQTAILNDPYCGGTHLPDVTLVAGVYLEGADAPAYYVANRAHHADIGGIAPGSLPVADASTGGRLSIDDEGFRIVPQLLSEELRAAFAQASRTPEERYGDLRAQEAANLVAQRGLSAMTRELGESRLARLNDALLDYAERRMRAVIGELADGVYAFEDYLDDDGAGGPAVRIPVELRIDGDSAQVDFRAAPDALPSSMNAVRAIAVSAVFYVFRCLGEDALPANGGLLRPITILTRPGSVIDALPPAAVSAGNVETSQRLVDVLLGALAGARSDIPAASAGTMNNVLFGGVDTRPGPRRGRPFVHYETLAGGAGASPKGPGASALHVHMTNTLNTPVEALERDFPVRILCYAVREPAPSSWQAPPGQTWHRGGQGIRRSYQFLADVHLTVVSERRSRAPWGLGGAPCGELGRNLLRLADGRELALPGKLSRALHAGDTLTVETPGGGSWAGWP